jgi:hypothetical protein
MRGRVVRVERLDALWAQAVVPSTYSWKAELALGRLRWQDFNREAAAQFLQEVWERGRLRGPGGGGNGVFYKDDPVGGDVEFADPSGDDTSLAIESIAYVRGAFAWRLSALLHATVAPRLSRGQAAVLAALARRRQRFGSGSTSKTAATSG